MIQQTNHLSLVIKQFLRVTILFSLLVNPRTLLRWISLAFTYNFTVFSPHFVPRRESCYFNRYLLTISIIPLFLIIVFSPFPLSYFVSFCSSLNNTRLTHPRTTHDITSQQNAYYQQPLFDTQSQMPPKS